MDDIFLSYSSEDRRTAMSIVYRLSGYGHRVWWDRKLRHGEDFGVTIQAALGASKCAVVAWSRFAQHSLWVRAEANAARESDKLVQLTLDGTTPPLPFSMLHTLDFKTDDGSADSSQMHELVASVESVIAGTSGIEKSSTSPWEGGLAGFGSAAAVGAASIGLIVLASALAGMSKYIHSADAFGLATTGMFCASVLGFAHMLVRVILTYVATRRR
ncbi:MAG: toll/interleukin-1 receptor domain-containing protein [Candidatus Thiodiazotropha endolucinida]